MAKQIDYDERWYSLLDKAAGGDRGTLDSMTKTEENEAILKAFRRYLAACYGDQVKRELGPALTPTKDIDVLRMKVMTIHHWKFSDVEKMNNGTLISALSDQLSHFTLPPEAVETVQNLMNQHQSLREALDHHRPDREAAR